MSKWTDRSRSDGSPLAVAVMFIGNGLVMGSSLSRMPEIRDQVGATPTSLAFALVCVGIGSIVSMPFTGLLADRYSSMVVSRVATVICLGCLDTRATSKFGADIGSDHARCRVGDWGGRCCHEHSRKRGRAASQQGPHAVLARTLFGWRGGRRDGGALAASLGLPLSWQLSTVSLLLLVAMWLATAFYVPDAKLHPAANRAQQEEPIFDEPQLLASERPRIAETQSSITRVEILLGIIVFGTAVGEGAANDWLALVLVDNRGAPAALGALTYAGFNLTMAIGRFVGGIVIERFGRAPVLRIAGLLGSAGVATVCLIPSTTAALIGALAWGLGLSVVFPSAMSAAGEVPGRGSRAITVVSTIGYGGFLLGAPLIGFLAHSVPLDRALLSVAFLILPVAILASVARERGSQMEPAPSAAK